MNNARLRDSFVFGFKISIKASVVLFAFIALILNGTQKSRADFVANHKLQVCTISSGKILGGKSQTYELALDCPDGLSRRLDVNESEYNAMKVGQEISLYTGSAVNGYYTTNEPTPEWRDKKRSNEWTVLVITFGLIGLVLWGIWWEANRDLEKLRKATILDAEVIGISVEGYKTMSSNVRLLFMVKGQPYEGVFPSNPAKMNEYFRNRKVQVAVDEESPAKSKIVSMFATSELIP